VDFYKVKFIFDPDFEVGMKLAQVDSLTAEVTLPDLPTNDENKNNFEKCFFNEDNFEQIS